MPDKLGRPMTAPALAALSFCLVFPSLGDFQKYLGTPFAAAYAILGPVLLTLYMKYRSRRALDRTTEREALFGSVLVFLLLAAAFLVYYPRLNTDLPTLGSDRDDMLNLAARKFLEGDYPFRVRTYTGNKVSVFPGSILLAAPFAMAGNVAYQNLFWVPAAFAVLCRSLKSVRAAFLFSWIVVVFSPSVLHEFVTGGDLIACALFNILFMVFLVESLVPKGPGRLRKILATALYAVGLSTRSNFLLNVPLVFSIIWKESGWKTAVKYFLLCSLFYSAVTLPFYFYDPAGFAPLYAQRYIFSRFRHFIPLSGYLLPIVCLIPAILLAMKYRDKDYIVLFRNCAIAQGIPVVMHLTLLCWQFGGIRLNRSNYGIPLLFYGALAVWLHWFRPLSSADHEGPRQYGVEKREA